MIILGLVSLIIIVMCLKGNPAESIGLNWDEKNNI